MLNIAIVEDNTSLRESLVDLLSADGRQVTGFEDAESFWAKTTLGPQDIVILDLNLPGVDGLGVAKRLRASNPSVGIIMLTARGEPDDRRFGYESGADIYLAKPSSAAELTSSVEALARRLNLAKPVPQALMLYTSKLTLAGPTGQAQLSASEAELLAEFLRAPDNRLDFQTISAIATRDNDLSKAAIEVRIVRLRKKLKDAGAEGQPLQAIRHRGYQLSVPVVAARGQ